MIDGVQAGEKKIVYYIIIKDGDSFSEVIILPKEAKLHSSIDSKLIHS